MSQGRTDGYRPIKRALISVYDKTGLEQLARGLHDAGVKIVSTGGSAALIAGLDIAVTRVEDLTGFPECLEGRVKTLHPRVYAGALADSRKPEHLSQLKDLGVELFDLVVSNLYPFCETVASGVDLDECIEQIDIGGPSMMRAGAKNHPTVAIVTSPTSYDDTLAAVAAGGFTLEQRKLLAAQAFVRTATYDNAVANWMRNVYVDTNDGTDFPMWSGATFTKSAMLRYGENPHQKAAIYRHWWGGIASAEQIFGKEMSYNNYVDADAAVRAAYDHGSLPTVAIIKHANPCGIAVGAPDESIASVHAKAHACDPQSAFGGVIATSRPVTVELAETVKDIFTEVVVAPDFEPGAIEFLSARKEMRLLKLSAEQAVMRNPVEFRSILGGMLMQECDKIDAVVLDGDSKTMGGDDVVSWQLVSGDVASTKVLADLQFAWRAVRAVKSNAILLATGGASLGVGMGQVNRVDSCHLAVLRAGEERARGSVAASDAFFPFPDGLQVLIDAGVKAVVAPGGSMRDQLVIDAAQVAGTTMYFTGTRHFAH